MSSGAGGPTARRALLPTVALTTFACLVWLLTAAPALAAVATPALMPPQVVVAPGSAVDSLNGLSIARDGSGGMIFLETVAGIPHVFVSRLEQGAWQPPEQVDLGLNGASSQPQIVADNHGELVVAFVNSSALYVSAVMNSSQAFSTPQEIALGASDPSLSMNTYGVGYLAYTADDGAGHNVDLDYFDGANWSPANPQAVNVTPGDDAGVGTGAPDVVAAGDGVGIVTWGESGHIYSRRVWGTSTSVETERLDPASIAGWSEVSADSPMVSAGGDSSYPDIVFREEVADAGQLQSRVLVTRLIAESTQPATLVDNLGVGSEGASQPALAMNEYGDGFVTAATDTGHQLIETPTTNNGVLQGSAALAPGGGSALPDAVPANAGLISNLIAWQQTPATGSTQILVSYAPNGADLGAPMVVSAAVNGPTDAAQGLFAAGDANGDAAIAWVQGQIGALSIDTAELVAGPGGAGGHPGVVYTKQNTPDLVWSAARESWGPVTYTVALDGAILGQTGALSWQPTVPLLDGPHLWQIKATNQAGLSSNGAVETLFVDTYPPVVHARLSGKLEPGKTLTLTLRDADPPNPREPGSKASGVAAVTVDWGDRTALVRGPTLPRATHIYRRSGRYTVTVTVTDRAGNAASVTRRLVIKPQQQAPPRRTGHLTPGTSTHPSRR